MAALKHPRNKTRRKTLDQVAKDPRIEEVWDEGEDGYWASLKPGYNAEGASAIHAWTVKDLISLMILIEEGDPF